MEHDNWNQGRGGRGRGRGGYHRGRGGFGNQGGGNGPTFTHFLAFPLWEKYGLKIKEYQDNFAKFVAQKYPQYTKHYTFQSPMSQHLTIVMIDLQTDERKEKAKEALKAAVEAVKLLAGGQLRLNLKAVDTFHDSNDKRIYFIDIDHSSPEFLKLIQLEDAVIRSFQKAGLIRPNKGGKELLQLSEQGCFHTTPHATFLRVAPSVQDPNFNKNIFPKIISEYNQAFLPNGFGPIEVDMIDICIRFSFGANGEYNHLERILFK